MLLNPWQLKDKPQRVHTWNMLLGPWQWKDKPQRVHICNITETKTAFHFTLDNPINALCSSSCIFKTAASICICGFPLERVCHDLNQGQFILHKGTICLWALLTAIAVSLVFKCLYFYSRYQSSQIQTQYKYIDYFNTFLINGQINLLWLLLSLMNVGVISEMSWGPYLRSGGTFEVTESEYHWIPISYLIAQWCVIFCIYLS